MRITANQVTFARLILMPFLGVLLYFGPTERVVAVIVGTIVGCTDLLDGYLARKHGPTVLGGLMDPIADKVFIAVGFLPMADRGWLPWWPVALLLVRELVVTAMRSSFEQRRRSLRTTYLAKVKTWVQMAGGGVLLLQLVIPSSAMLWLLAAGVGGAIAASVIFYLVARRGWLGSWIFAGSFAAGLAAFLVGGHGALRWLIVLGVLGITWASGLDYVTVFVREVARRGELHAFDSVRIAGATLLPVLTVLALAHGDAAPCAIIAVTCIELAHAGLDNLLAHHGVAASALAWGGRVLLASACLLAALVAPPAADVLVLIAFFVSAGATARAFARNRRYYLEAPARPTATATVGRPG